MRSTFSAVWNRLTGQGGDGDHGALSDVKPRPDIAAGQIEELLEHSPLIRTACEAMAEDIVRAWRTYPTDGARWIDADELFDTRSVVERALFYAEAFGGAIILPRYPENILSADQLALPARKIRAGSLLGFMVLAPHQLSASSRRDLKYDPVNNLPMAYELPVADSRTGKIEIHASWTKPVFGAMRVTRPSAHANGLNMRFGLSKVDLIFNDFSRLISGLQNLSHLLTKSNIDVLKVAGLADAMKGCSGPEEMARKIQGLLQTATFTLKGANNMQPMVIDSEESLERKGLASGNPQAYVELFLQVFVAATRVPRTRLLGEQAKGLGNGGDVDLTNYYDRCANVRERRATPIINWIDSLVATDQGLSPMAWDYAPLWQMTAKEKAEIEAKQAETDLRYLGQDIPFMLSKVVARLAGNATYDFTPEELAAIAETDGPVDGV